MKIIVLLLTIVVARLHAQPLTISDNETVTLVFPHPIHHVDRGSPEVIVQKAAPNILLVKAGTAALSPTNLSVILTKGTVYCFAINYARTLSEWVIEINDSLHRSVKDYANALLDNPPVLRTPKDDSWGVEVRLTGIYIKDQTMFFQLRLKNSTNINYDIEDIRGFIRDQRRAKRTAIQETLLEPMVAVGNLDHISSKSDHNVVLALEKWTIPNAKKLCLQITEKKGGRHLLLNIKNSKLIRAVPLSD